MEKTLHKTTTHTELQMPTPKRDISETRPRGYWTERRLQQAALGDLLQPDPRLVRDILVRAREN
jgi:hypothetical protein